MLVDFSRPLMAILCVCAIAYKLVTTTSLRSDKAVLCLLLALASEAVGWTLSMSDFAKQLDQWVGFPNLSTLIMELMAAVILGPFLLMTVILWSYRPEEARRWTRLVLVYALTVLIAMLALWTMARVETEGDLYLARNMHRTIVIVYIIVYELGYGVGIAALVRFSWVYSKVAHDIWLRRALRLITFGAGCYLSISVIRLVSIVARRFGHNPADWEFLIWIASPLGILGIVSGFILPSAVDQSRAIRNWFDDLSSIRALKVLWSDLNQAFPHVSLLNSQLMWRYYLRPVDVRFLLSRLSVEIRDSWRSLRPYMSEEESVLGADKAIAERAAYSLLLGLESHSRDVQGNNQFRARPLERLDIVTFEAEISWLVEVARAYSTLRHQPSTKW